MTRCSCGAELNPDNTTGECAECSWYRRNGTQRDPAHEVDERQGLINAINILCTPPRRPAVTLTKAETGKYLAEFAYDQEIVALLKAAAPSTMRRWHKAAKCWEVSAEWTGPLIAALRNAHVPIAGLEEPEEAGLFGWCAPPCRDADRMARAHRVRSVLAAKGLARWPTAAPSKGDAYVCRAPVLVDTDNVTIPAAPDYAAAADAVITAQALSCAPSCPVCGRKLAGGAAVHAGCRHRFLALLAEKPFSKPRNEAFQDGRCTCCLTRPLQTSGITCGNCAALTHRIKERL
jgi:hypothetical protein